MKRRTKNTTSTISKSNYKIKEIGKSDITNTGARPITFWEWNQTDFVVR
jgi:hypothetical protein